MPPAVSYASRAFSFGYSPPCAHDQPGWWVLIVLMGVSPMSRALTSDEFREEMRAQGRWDEFKAYRGALELRGASKRDSWIEAARAFGYKGKDGGERKSHRVGRVDPHLAPKDAFEGKEGNLRGDFEWVYANIGVDGIEASDAPSSGAWGLLEFARSDRKSFYQSWMSMVSKQIDVDEVMEGFRQDASRSVDEISEMLRATVPPLVQPGSEGHTGEPEVPEGDTEESGDGSGVSEGVVASV